MSSPSLEGTEFLDTFIYNKGYKLNTKVYSKPCDTHSFLVPTSCHATHIVENIPKGVAHRLFRICSEQENDEIAKSEFTEFLLRQEDTMKIWSAMPLERLKNKTVVVFWTWYPMVLKYHLTLPEAGVTP